MGFSCFSGKQTRLPLSCCCVGRVTVNTETYLLMQHVLSRAMPQRTRATANEMRTMSFSSALLGNSHSHS